MSAVSTLIKWPGGKTREIKYIEHMIPQYDRYIEPFFGGGAMFFYLKPQAAIINDISRDLIDFYTLVKGQDQELKNVLLHYCSLFENLLMACEEQYDEILRIYYSIKNSASTAPEAALRLLADLVCDSIDETVTCELILNTAAYKKQLYFSILGKMRRTVKNEIKAPFSEADLKENLFTGFTSGTYKYFRDIYNDILLGRNQTVSRAYRSANFYFIREYCYGSMFRYNDKGEFNIPYGGMSYNRKDLRKKVEDIFNVETQKLFSTTDIHCQDFEDFFASVDLNEQDFMFLDPPYDTDFSDYEGKRFTPEDHRRLAAALEKTKARFILLIRNTDFIYSLYENHFHIFRFDKTYTYNVRSRNERNVEYLIVTNLPAK